MAEGRWPGHARGHRIVPVLAALVWACGIASGSWAKVEKPTVVAEEFFRLLAAQQYEAAADLLCAADRDSARQLQAQASAQAPAVELPKLLADTFFLLQGQTNAAMVKKLQDGETILPQRITFFVPGQYYVIGNFAAVFTREIYELARADTGPVRDDPRKLWIDPTNVLSKVRDEAYFKQWWLWENESLTMPGLVWMVKERSEWKVDLFGATVPRKAFKEILRWHFGRDVFEEEKPAKAQPGAEKPGSAAGQKAQRGPAGAAGPAPR
jgi:hypothetical protein